VHSHYVDQKHIGGLDHFVKFNSFLRHGRIRVSALFVLLAELDHGILSAADRRRSRSGRLYAGMCACVGMCALSYCCIYHLSLY